MPVLWTLLAAVCCAVLSFAQHLQREKIDVSVVRFSDALQEESDTNIIEVNQLKSWPLRHNVENARPLEKKFKRELFNTRLTHSTSSWEFETLNKAAAEMLSQYFAQCLAVVTTTAEEERLDELITTLDIAGVPRLILQRQKDIMTKRKTGTRVFLLLH